MKRQVVVNHTIGQNVIPALLASWVMNTSSVKMLRTQKIASRYIPKKT